MIPLHMALLRVSGVFEVDVKGHVQVIGRLGVLDVPLFREIAIRTDTALPPHGSVISVQMFRERVVLTLVTSAEIFWFEVQMKSLHQEPFLADGHLIERCHVRLCIE